MLPNGFIHLNRQLHATKGYSQKLLKAIVIAKPVFEISSDITRVSAFGCGLKRTLDKINVCIPILEKLFDQDLAKALKARG